MLGDKDAAANIAVRDLKTAKKFYQDILGLTQVGAEGQEVIVFKSGNSLINVYRSQYAGTNQATAVTWVVGEDIEDVVQQLKAKKVAFEHYDMPGVTRQGDVHVADNMKVAWFKDPDGNISTLPVDSVNRRRLLKHIFYRPNNLERMNRLLQDHFRPDAINL